MLSGRSAASALSTSTRSTAVTTSSTPSATSAATRTGRSRDGTRVAAAATAASTTSTAASVHAKRITTWRVRGASAGCAVDVRQLELLIAQRRSSPEAELLQRGRHPLREEALRVLLGLPHVQAVHAALAGASPVNDESFDRRGANGLRDLAVGV